MWREMDISVVKPLIYKLAAESNFIKALKNEIICKPYILIHL